MVRIAIPEPVYLVVGAAAALLVGTAGVAIGLQQPEIGTASRAEAIPTPLPAIVAATASAAPTAAATEAGSQPMSGALTADPAPHAAADWVTRTASAAGIPARALAAYADATLAIETSDPGCHLGWTTLAAIGAIESGHGTHGGTTLGDDGRPLQPILGPALDGVGGFAAIRASAGSQQWTGDPTWDHAVGPMQFLTSTWQRWSVDADGDGVADPNDLDDAALAAGHYLCASGGDLAGADGWWTAVRAYNHDDAYVASVLSRADAYARTASA
ncbi:MAG: lytic transglycosylase domain-containing protein [Actinobacteria bacterium]|nr:lytic transglycosylase domain-containing protein [Actinomycetota bacterium]MCG2802457.1 lytic transglycosylase domain-containing protein [Cellulomonas sp.]